MQLAQLNLGRLTHAPGAPEVAEFVDAIAKINAIAERSAGFVWRLKDEDGAVGALETVWDAADPRVIVNMSVWTDFPSLEAFVWKTAHARFVERREAWFEPFGGAFLALWRVPDGHRPTLEEARERLARLEAAGPTEAAMDWAFAERALSARA